MKDDKEQNVKIVEQSGVDLKEAKTQIVELNKNNEKLITLVKIEDAKFEKLGEAQKVVEVEMKQFKDKCSKSQ